jgi:hypothetical protein
MSKLGRELSILQRLSMTIQSAKDCAVVCIGRSTIQFFQLVSLAQGLRLFHILQRDMWLLNGPKGNCDFVVEIYCVTNQIPCVKPLQTELLKPLEELHGQLPISSLKKPDTSQRSASYHILSVRYRRLVLNAVDLETYLDILILNFQGFGNVFLEE